MPLRSLLVPLLALFLASPASHQNQVEMVGTWGKDVPNLVVCEGAFLGDMEDVHKVVRRIRRHGGRINGPEIAICEGTPEANTIWLAGWAEGVFGLGIAGVTFTEYDRPPVFGIPGDIRTAVVFADLNYGIGCLEHELLHAMGVGHDTRPGYIMFPAVNEAGDNWSGIQL